MNSLSSTNPAPALCTMSLTALLSACTATDKYGNCVDFITECPDEHNHSHQHGNYTHTHNGHESGQEHHNHPERMSVYLGFHNSKVYFHDIKTNQHIFTLNTDSNGHANFDLIQFRNILNDKGISPDQLLYMKVNDGQITRINGVTSNIRNGIEYILSRRDLKGIVDTKSMQMSDPGMVFAESYLNKKQDVFYNSGQSFIDNIQAQIAANFASNMEIGDINGDGEITYTDINQSFYSPKASEYIVDNGNSITIYSPKINDIYIIQEKELANNGQVRMELTYGVKYDNARTRKEGRYRVNNGEWREFTTPNMATIYANYRDVIETREGPKEDSEDINRYIVTYN